MFRDILTNKWVLSGVGFLIVLSIACVLAIDAPQFLNFK